MYSFLPVIDKPTRVYNNSATLIDNILVNRIDYKLSTVATLSLILVTITLNFASYIPLHLILASQELKSVIILNFWKKTLTMISPKLTGTI